MLRVLYAIQGTGNGHISRASAIIPLLKTLAHVDVLISGTECQLDFPFPVTYRLKGLSFCANKQGAIDYWKTFKKSKLRELYSDIKQLPVEDYDLVVNDFEPVSAWACQLKQVYCVGLSHQAAVHHHKSPKPESKDLLGDWVLGHYAPVHRAYGFHFDAYAKRVFTPVIREEIRKSKLKNKGHYTVYLPAYNQAVIERVLEKIPETTWHIFSKECTEPRQQNNLHFFPINNQLFVRSFIESEGILCGAGFETPAEALFMKKKLMVIPMKGQYEQQCNAAALRQMGVPVLKRLRKKHIPSLRAWIESEQEIAVEYPNNTLAILQHILDEYPYIILKKKKHKKMGFNAWRKILLESETVEVLKG